MRRRKERHARPRAPLPFTVSLIIDELTNPIPGPDRPTLELILVPEPAAGVLMCSVFATIAALRRRRSASAR